MDKNTYKQEILGITTSNGIKVNGITEHALDRAIERNVYPQSISLALLHPEKIKDGNVPNRKVYVRKGINVILDTNTGDIITIIYKGR